MTAMQEEVKLKSLALEFVTAFAVTLVAAAPVTFVWSFMRHVESSVDWKTSFSFAILLGIVLDKGKGSKEK
jgi:hypothetical protein